MRVLAVFLGALIMLAGPKAALADEAAVWQALQTPGHFAVMRHALAPGGGDPVNFMLDDCSTQRNLSQEGREQARNAGNMFRANGIAEVLLFTSQWCRCKETAELMDLGAVEELPSLNSFFENREREAPQMRALKAKIVQLDLTRPTVMVTHQVLITSLTGVVPASGEMVVVKRMDNGELQTVGRLKL